MCLLPFPNFGFRCHQRRCCGYLRRQQRPEHSKSSMTFFFAGGYSLEELSGCCAAPGNDDRVGTGNAAPLFFRNFRGTRTKDDPAASFLIGNDTLIHCAIWKERILSEQHYEENRLIRICRFQREEKKLEERYIELENAK